MQTTINAVVQNLDLRAKTTAKLFCMVQPLAASISMPNIAVQLVIWLAVRPPCLEIRAKNLPFTVSSQLYGLAENVLLKCYLGKCAKLLPPSPHCLEISLALLLSFSQSAHERMNDLFLLFLL